MRPLLGGPKSSRGPGREGGPGTPSCLLSLPPHTQLATAGPRVTAEDHQPQLRERREQVLRPPDPQGGSAAGEDRWLQPGILCCEAAAVPASVRREGSRQPAAGTPDSRPAVPFLGPGGGVACQCPAVCSQNFPRGRNSRPRPAAPFLGLLGRGGGGRAGVPAPKLRFPCT